MMATKASTANRGKRMAYANASRSQAMCMKTATINPALSIMKIRMSDHRIVPCRPM